MDASTASLVGRNPPCEAVGSGAGRAAVSLAGESNERAECVARVERRAAGSRPWGGESVAPARTDLFPSPVPFANFLSRQANSVTTSYAALITLIHTAPPAGSPSLNLSKLLTSVPSTLPTLHTLPSLAAQDYYRLLTHVLPHGLPQVAAVYSRTLTEAREIVYAAPSAASNLQTAEGGVDWRVVWALNVVQHWNMRRGMEGRVWEEEETSEAPWPWKMEHARPRGLSERVWLSEEKEDWDWAGIGGGEWVGCYSFIDFR